MSSISILTIDEAKAALSSDSLDNDSDTLINLYIESISKRLDQVCGPIVQRTITDELYDGGSCHIWLKNKPIVSITTLTEYYGTSSTVLTEQTPGTTPTEGYILDKNNAKVTRVASGNKAYFDSGIQNIKITYVTGRYSTTSTVDSLFKLAAGAFLSHVWKTEQGMGSVTYGNFDGSISTPTYSLPNRVKDLLGTELLLPEIA